MPAMHFSFRLDEPVDFRVKEISRRFGITPAEAFRMFAQAFVESDGFPFPVRLNGQEKNPALEPFSSEREMYEEEQQQPPQS